MCVTCVCASPATLAEAATCTLGARVACVLACMRSRVRAWEAGSVLLDKLACLRDDPCTVTIDEIRRKIGLSKTQMFALLEDSRRSVLLHHKGPMYKRAVEIGESYTEFLTSLGYALDRAFETPDAYVEDQPVLSTLTASRILGVGEFHLANLINRGRLTSHKIGRRTFFTRDDLVSLLDKDDDMHTPLAAAFLRFMGADASTLATGFSQQFG